MSKKLQRTFIYAFFIIYILYIFADYNTSASAGIVGANRFRVYVCMFFCVLLQAVFILITYWSKGFQFSRVAIALLLIALWVFVSSVLTNSLNRSYIVYLGLNVWWITTYFFFYSIYDTSKENFILVRNLFIIVFFIYCGINLGARNNIKENFNKDYAVLNYVYYLIVFVPFITLIKNRKVKYLLYVIAIVMTVASFKRGAILTLPIMLIGGMLVEAHLQNTMRKTVKQIVLFAIIFLLALFLIDAVSNGFLLNRFSKENMESGSGRADMYQKLINDILNRDVFHLFVGRGSGSSLKIVGTGAHNEILEFLSSYGIIGLVLYLAWLMAILLEGIRLIKYKSEFAAPIIMSFIYIVLVGLVGSIFFAHSSIVPMALLGASGSEKAKRGKLYENRNYNLSQRI